MEFNFAQNLQYCRDIVDNVSGLLYYSHIPSIIISLIIGFFVLVRSKFSLLGKILFSITVAFSLWVSADLLIWVFYYKNSVVMSAWAPTEIFALALFILCLYFEYVFIEKRDVSFLTKLLVSFPLLVLILVVPTSYNLVSFDIQECIAVENPVYSQSILAIKLLLSAWIVIFAIYKYIKVDRVFKKQILLLSIGMLIFLLSFLGAGYAAEVTYVYMYEAAGLFGMVIFLAFLGYLIVRFKTFNIKLIGSQALIISIVALVGSQFFFIQNNTNKILTAITLVIVGVVGINLIRSVKKEIEAREKIEKLATDLQKANEGQTNLIHIMNHQIKGYLAKARGIFSELLSEPTYGPVSDVAKPMIKEGFDSLTEGVGFVQQVLNGSSAESGTLVYSMKPVDIKMLVEEVSSKEKEKAEKKGLAFEVSIADGNYSANADAIHVKEAVRNLIENSIIYTPSGGLTIHLEKTGDKIRFSVKDTGLGITAEDKAKLFTKGGRGKDSLKVNVNSTGYGLAFVKGVAEAHKGRVWVESEGAGKGSTFYLEILAA